MNEEFKENMSARLTELTSGLQLYHLPTDSLKPPEIVYSMLPPPAAGYEEWDKFPVVRWAVYEGAFRSRKPFEFAVVINGGIHSPDTIEDGTRDIQVLAMALGRVVENRHISPYKLAGEVPYRFGDPAKGHEGLQPHPYYWVKLILPFIGG